MFSNRMKIGLSSSNFTWSEASSLRSTLFSFAIHASCSTASLRRFEGRPADIVGEEGKSFRTWYGFWNRAEVMVMGTTEKKVKIYHCRGRTIYLRKTHGKVSCRTLVTQVLIRANGKHYQMRNICTDGHIQQDATYQKPQSRHGLLAASLLGHLLHLSC